MEGTPPPYLPPPVQKSKSTNTLLIILGLFGICCVGGIATLGYFGFKVFKQAVPLAGCAVNFQLAQTAVHDYIQDHNGKFPNASTWQDDVSKYYQTEFEKMKLSKRDSQAILKVPGPNDLWGCDLGEGDRRSGMAFNSDLSAKKLSDVKDPFTTVMLFEVENGGKNLNETYKERPIETSPKILGKPRGWLKASISGSVQGTNGADINVKTE